jgi:hypothetical protein
MNSQKLSQTHSQLDPSAFGLTLPRPAEFSRSRRSLPLEDDLSSIDSLSWAQFAERLGPCLRRFLDLYAVIDETIVLSILSAAYLRAEVHVICDLDLVGRILREEAHPFTPNLPLQGRVVQVSEERKLLVEGVFQSLSKRYFHPATARKQCGVSEEEYKSMKASVKSRVNAA